MTALHLALALAPAAAALAPAPRAQDVWIVDADGGGDFTKIQPAVDAAADGDTIVVRKAATESVTIDGKGLHILQQWQAPRATRTSCSTRRPPSRKATRTS